MCSNFFVEKTFAPFTSSAFVIFSSFDLLDENGNLVTRDQSTECKQSCGQCFEVKEAKIQFKEITRVTNFTLYGCCGDPNLTLRLFSKIFPANSATFPLLQSPGDAFHHADLWSLTTKELIVSHNLNHTLRICDVKIFGQTLDSIFNVRFVTVFFFEKKGRIEYVTFD